jgi:hypothetical protein
LHAIVFWLRAALIKRKIGFKGLGIGECPLDVTQLSYVHGASNAPFIGDTIGVHFDRIVEHFAERPMIGTWRRRGGRIWLSMLKTACKEMVANKLAQDIGKDFGRY